jgi:hypothetical protein
MIISIGITVIIKTRYQPGEGKLRGEDRGALIKLADNK